MKKMFVALAMSAVMALSAGMLVACGGNVDEDIIREELTQELESIKNLDDEFVGQMAAAVAGSELDQMGISAEEFVSSYLAGFDYTIGEIVVDGETATAEVTMSCKSYQGFMNDMNEMVNSSEINDALSAMASESEMYQYLGTKMMEVMDAVTVAECLPIVIEYTLIDNEWVPTAESEAAITNAMLTN